MVMSAAADYSHKHAKRTSGQGWNSTVDGSQEECEGVGGGVHARDHGDAELRDKALIAQRLPCVGILHKTQYICSLKIHAPAERILRSDTKADPPASPTHAQQ